MIMLTIISLTNVQLYEQFVINQPQEAWNDIALLLTVNSLVLLSLSLYLAGGLNPLRIKLRYLLAGYMLFGLVGFLFTIFKYAVLREQDINQAEV